MANVCIQQCFPCQNPKSTDLPKFYLAKVLCYIVSILCSKVVYLFLYRIGGADPTTISEDTLTVS